MIISAPYLTEDGLWTRGAVYLVTAADLAGADEADGMIDGVISLANVSAQAGSWKLVGEGAFDRAGFAALTADTDGDGNLELIVGAPGNARQQGAVYVVPTSSLEAADNADGNSDHVVNLGNVTGLGERLQVHGRRVPYPSWALRWFSCGYRAGGGRHGRRRPCGARDRSAELPGRRHLVPGAWRATAVPVPCTWFPARNSPAVTPRTATPMAWSVSPTSPAGRTPGSCWVSAPTVWEPASRPRPILMATAAPT